VSGFARLLRLEVRHDYHGDQPPPIVLVPDAATARLAARPDLHLRLADATAELFAADHRDALALLAEAGPLAITLRVRARSPALIAVTEPLARDRIAVLDPGPRSGGPLHAGETVAAADLRPLAVDGLITPSDLASPPLAIVRVPVDPAAEDALFTIRFAAARRYWTYHVIGGSAGTSYAVRDPTGAVGFRPLGARRMSNGAPAQSFCSTAPIAEAARPAARFELTSEGPFGPRTVMPVLPCPRPGPGAIDRSDGTARAVSEIYVNIS
jgi:hypothetical protein